MLSVLGSENALGNWTPVTRADVAGLDEVVQKLRVRRLKVHISTIGPEVSGSLWTEFISEPQNQNHLEEQIEQTRFHIYDFKKRNLVKRVALRLLTIVKAQNDIMQGGKVDGNR